MPRIYKSNNDPVDFCKRHFPSEEDAEDCFMNCGDGPDGRGNCFDYNADHPLYDDTDYTCEECGKRLTEEDD